MNEYNFNSYEELKESHPTGNIGDAYLVNGKVYVWDDNLNNWMEQKSPIGAKKIEEPYGIVGPCVPTEFQEPKVIVGPVTVKCCGEPTIVPGTTCKGVPVGECRFNIKQKFCIKKPNELHNKQIWSPVGPTTIELDNRPLGSLRPVNNNPRSQSRSKSRTRSKSRKNII